MCTADKEMNTEAILAVMNTTDVVVVCSVGRALVSSVGRVLHRHLKVHGFKFCMDLNFFRSYFN